MIPSALFKKREKHSWKAVTSSKVAGFSYAPYTENIRAKIPYSHIQAKRHINYQQYKLCCYINPLPPFNNHHNVRFYAFSCAGQDFPVIV